MKLKKNLNEKNSFQTLNAFLAHAGICSRRNAVDYITYGRVTVNKEIVTDPGYRVKPEDRIAVDGRTIARESFVYIVMNKPTNYITTVSDEEGRSTVMDLLGNLPQRVYPIGRLDRNTTGVLLLTNDGDLTNKLAHPRFNVKKEYEVILQDPITPDDEQALKRGIRLEDGVIRFDRIEISHETVVRVLLHSGKNRILRRTFEALGHRIKTLHRTSYAGITTHGLAFGAWRYLTKKEILDLKKYQRNG